MANIRNVTIVVDDREELDRTANLLTKYPGVTVERKDLEGGDFIVAPNVIVLRKTPHNLMLSVKQKRLFEQIGLLQTGYEECIILVEGNPYEHDLDMPDSAVDGTLSYMSLLSGSKLICSPDNDKTIGLLWRMSLHLTHGLGYEVNVREGKPADPTLNAKYLLQGLPKVNGEIANKLLKHFGSPLAVFNASLEDLKLVENIPVNIVETIYKTLRQ